MKSTILTLFLLLTLSAYAQPAPPGGGNAPVPLDGGIVLLLAAGAAYGGRMYKAKN